MPKQLCIFCEILKSAIDSNKKFISVSYLIMNMFEIVDFSFEWGYIVSTENL